MEFDGKCRIVSGSQEVIGSIPICSTFARRSELRWTQSTLDREGETDYQRVAGFRIRNLFFFARFLPGSLQSHNDIRTSEGIKKKPPSVSDEESLRFERGFDPLPLACASQKLRIRKADSGAYLIKLVSRGSVCTTKVLKY